MQKQACNMQTMQQCNSYAMSRQEGPSSRGLLSRNNKSRLSWQGGSICPGDSHATSTLRGCCHSPASWRGLPEAEWVPCPTKAH